MIPHTCSKSTSPKMEHCVHFRVKSIREQIIQSGIILLLLWNCVFANHSPDHPLHGRLRTWQTISADEILVHRPKRSLDGPSMNKKVTFKAFDRQFTLALVSSPEIFAPDFHASVVSRTGTVPVQLDRSKVYRGTVIGEPGSEVQAHLEDKDLMASIKTKQDTYIVEPSWRHIPGDTVDGHRQKSKMIVYRQSDVNLTRLGTPHESGGYCGVEKIMKEIRANNTILKEGKKSKIDGESRHSSRSDHSHGHHRGKRSNTQRHKICNLALVADYRFFGAMGNSNYLQTMYYLINLIDRVNQIFKSTNWDVNNGTDEYMGYGFQISDIQVHTESSTSYNAPGDWTAKELLEAFSKVQHKYCLAHLFTYVDFDKGVLGLAYVGASKIEDVGGVCTDPYRRGEGKDVLYLNTGLTTTRNWNQRILTLEADLVTTHELGHNFGAEHDNGEIEECSPGESNNGNFIMYPAAVSGDHPNNKLFSVCSKHNVFRVLQSKAPKCFKEYKKLFCGNYKVEEGEECDVGYLKGVGEEDSCCTRNCKLKPHAKCSNKNSVCCNEQCQAADSSTLCYSEVPESCFRNTYCDGKNFMCPPHLHKNDSEPCGDNGKCKAGKCQPFCNTVGMKPCLCTDKKEHFCLRCCAPAKSSGDEMIQKCKPYPNETVTLSLRDNARCTLGYCSEGNCIKQTQDVIERVWSIFEHIAPDKIGEFLADNIVGAVLVFSLLFWVPCGCLVNFVDKKREKNRREEEKWFTEKGSDFSRPNPYGGMFGSSNTLNKIANKNSRGGVMAMRAGMNARDQWRQSQERGIAARRKSQENIVSGGSNKPETGRGEGLVDAYVNKSNSAVTRPNNLNVGFRDPAAGVRLLPVRRDPTTVEGPTPNSSRSSTPRPLLRRQDYAIEEDDLELDLH